MDGLDLFYAKVSVHVYDMVLFLFAFISGKNFPTDLTTLRFLSSVISLMFGFS